MEGYGMFCYELGQALEGRHLVHLTTVFEFSPAECSNLLYETSMQNAFVSLLKGKGIISNRGISKLTNALRAMSLEGVAESVEQSFRTHVSNSTGGKAVAAQTEVLLGTMNEEYERLLYSAVREITANFDAVVDIITREGTLLDEGEMEVILRQEKPNQKTSMLMSALTERDDAAFERFLSLLEMDGRTKVIVEQMIRSNPTAWLACENRFHLQGHRYKPLEAYEDAPREINILLIGKTGVGKSTTANMILNSETFEVGSTSESTTKRTTYGCTRLGQTTIAIIDSPGIFDTDRNSSPDEQMMKIANAAFDFRNGIHVFIVVCVAGAKFTDEERQTIASIEKALSDRFYQNCILVLTRAAGSFHGPDKSLERFVSAERQVGSEMAALIDKVQGRIVAVENKPEFDVFYAKQRQKFVGFLADILSANGWQPYSNEIFEEMKEKAEEAERARLFQLRETENKTEMTKRLTHYFHSYLRQLVARDLDNLFMYLKSNVAEIRTSCNVDELETITDADMLKFFEKYIADSEQYVAGIRDTKLKEEKRKLSDAISVSIGVANLSNILPKNIEQISQIERTIEAGEVPSIFSTIVKNLTEHGYDEQNVRLGILNHLTGKMKQIAEYKLQIAKNEIAKTISEFLHSQMKNWTIDRIKSLEELIARGDDSHQVLDMVITRIKKSELNLVFVDDQLIKNELNRQLRAFRHEIAALRSEKELQLLRDEQARQRKIAEKERIQREKLASIRRNVAWKISNFTGSLLDRIDKEYSIEDIDKLQECLNVDTIPADIARDALEAIPDYEKCQVGNDFITDILRQWLNTDTQQTTIRELRANKARALVVACIHEKVNSKLYACANSSDYRSLEEAVESGHAQSEFLDEIYDELPNEKDSIGTEFFVSEMNLYLGARRSYIVAEAEFWECKELELREMAERDRIERQVSDFIDEKLPAYFGDKTYTQLQEIQRTLTDGSAPPDFCDQIHETLSSFKELAGYIRSERTDDQSRLPVFEWEIETPDRSVISRLAYDRMTNRLQLLESCKNSKPWLERSCVVM